MAPTIAKVVDPEALYRLALEKRTGLDAQGNKLVATLRATQAAMGQVQVELERAAGYLQALEEAHGFTPDALKAKENGKPSPENGSEA